MVSEDSVVYLVELQADVELRALAAERLLVSICIGMGRAVPNRKKFLKKLRRTAFDGLAPAEANSPIADHIERLIRRVKRAL